MYTLAPNPNDLSGKPLAFTIEETSFDENSIAENIMTATGQVIATTMATIGNHTETLPDSQIMYLSEMYDRLDADRKKLDSLDSHTSAAAREVAAHLYFSDALKFLRVVHLMVKQEDSGVDVAGKEGIQ